MGAPDLMSTVIREVAALVSRLAGIQLGPQQHPMVQRRIHSRMLRLGLSGPDEYLQYLRTHMEAESQELVSLLTTHHTFFFREQVHFDHLESMLPELVARARKRGDRTIRIWSAASSTGQEAYSLSMFFSMHLGKIAPDVHYEILGTDVDAASVAVATNGVYQKRELNKVPLVYLAEHWAKGHGEIADFVKAKDSLRKPVRFQPMNLLADTRLQHFKKFDVIFCRNVFIYFNEKQIEDCVRYLLSQLDPDGRIFLGVSESLVTLSSGVEAYGNAIFGHKRAAMPAAVAVPVVTAKAAPAVQERRKLRVLCVDDSKSILGLLGKILTPDSGFEIVATAENGVEAAAKLKQHQVDVITLDIHMPEMDGVSYLARHYGASHPPVVMISSVSREDAGLAVRALQLGATDYVEKPSLQNFAEASEEIRAKLRLAAATGKKTGDVFDAAFAKKAVIKETKGKLTVIVTPVAQTKQLARLLAQLDAPFPPVVVVVDGASNIADELARNVQVPTHLGRTTYDATSELKPNTVYVAAGSEVLQQLARRQSGGKTCVLVMGQASKAMADAALEFRSAYIVTEDLQGLASSAQQRLAAAAREVVPLSTFAYCAQRHLGDE